MLLNTFSRNKRPKNDGCEESDGGLKMALLDLKECHHLDAKILLVPRPQLIVPSPLLAPATDIRTYKATKILTLKPLKNELLFQNSSTTRLWHRQKD